MPSVYVCSVGKCRGNLLDSQHYKEFFIQNGWKLTSKIQEADMILLNTCAYSSKVEDVCIQKIGELEKKRKPDAKLVICGCLPDINTQRLRKAFKGDVFTPTTEHKLDELINAEKKIAEIGEPTNFDLCAEDYQPYKDETKAYVTGKLKGAYRLARRFRVRALYDYCINSLRDYRAYEAAYKLLNYNLRSNECVDQYSGYIIRVADGCLGSCTYCSIRKARGKLKSRPPEEIIDALREGVSKGEERITVFGDDIGAYGLDIGLNFPDILRRMLEVEGDFRLQLYNLNPNWLIKYFPELKELMRNKKIGVVHCPLQSGSDRVLELMKREHTSADIVECLSWIRREAPHVKLSTYVMVGFPGETEKDFEDTLRVLDAVRFDDIVRVVQYTDRPGTLSSEIRDKVPEDVMAERQRRAYWKLIKNTLGA